MKKVKWLKIKTIKETKADEIKTRFNDFLQNCREGISHCEENKDFLENSAQNIKILLDRIEELEKLKDEE